MLIQAVFVVHLVVVEEELVVELQLVLVDWVDHKDMAVVDEERKVVQVHKLALVVHIQVLVRMVNNPLEEVHLQVEDIDLVLDTVDIDKVVDDNRLVVVDKVLDLVAVDRTLEHSQADKEADFEDIQDNGDRPVVVGRAVVEAMEEFLALMAAVVQDRFVVVAVVEEKVEFDYLHLVDH